MSKKPRNPPELSEGQETVIYNLAEEGYSIYEIADITGISKSTIYDYKDDNSIFADKLEAAMLMPVEKVEKALFKRALGFKHRETKVHFDQETGIPSTYDVVKTYAPDPTSLKYFLGNRAPSKWKDKKEVDFRDLKEMDDAELEKKVQEILSKRDE